MKKERTIRSAPFRKPAESPRIPDWAIEYANITYIHI